MLNTWNLLTEEGTMPEATGSKVAGQFVLDFTKFLHDRTELQKQFVAWHFEMLEEAHQQSGSPLSLDNWLTEVATHRRFGQSIWPEYVVPGYSQTRAWKLIFDDDGSVLDREGRGQFVAAFNKLLMEKGMRTGLADNGTSLYFVDMTRWNEPRR